MTLDSAIASFRAFNRFHTRLVGALDEHLLQSDYSLPQVRILYEVANAPRGEAVSASVLATDLRLDHGYVSRLVSGLESAGLIERTPSPDNAKRLRLTPTKSGRELFARLDKASASEVRAMIAPLSERDRDALIGAMARIRALLGDPPKDRTVILRDPVPGDMGRVIERQGRIYHEDYGWDWTYEALVAEIIGQFVKNFDADREKCWIAERDGEVAGSVFLVRQDDQIAKLRLLYVEPSARGLGLGRRLVEECLRFAKSRGYRRIELWTNDCLTSARRIYEAVGFTLVREEPHRSFGKDLLGQFWGRDL